MIGIIDYGMGNITSIKNMIHHVGGDAIIVSDPKELNNVSKLIIPGVGAFDNGMQKLNERGFTDHLHQHVLQEEKPVLGICLGMQLMTRRSEEGMLAGLGWFDAETYKMHDRFGSLTLRIPHMGWNTVTFKTGIAISEGLHEQPRFYFVHGYAVRCHNIDDVLCQAHYGQDFTAGIMRQHIYGVQFHPEKSHRYGKQLLYNFSCVV